jgi:hypothetical protein
MTNPDTGNLPELDIEAENLAERALNLPTVGRLTKQNRKHVEALLGKERAEKIKKLDAYVVREIYQEIAKRRSGLQGIFRVERPGDQTLQLSRGNEHLRDLVSDPNSKEAQALLWFYSEHVNATNLAEFSSIFECMAAPDIRNVSTLKKMREIHEKLVADDGFFNLGHEGTIDAATGRLNAGTGSGKIGRKEAEIDRLEGSIEARIAANQDPKRLEDRVEVLEKDLRELNKKKRDLEKELNQLNTLGAAIQPIGVAPIDVHTASENFDSDTVPGHWNTPHIVIHGTDDTLDDWLTDDTRKKDIERLEKLAKLGPSVAGRRVRAQDALSRLVRNYFHDRVQFTDGQEERFYKEIERMLLNMSGGTEGEGAAKEKDKGDTKGPVGKVWGGTRWVLGKIFGDKNTPIGFR